MKRLDLNRDWQLHEAPLFWNELYLPSVKQFREGWLSCDVPADVRMPLLAAGRIQDPVLGDYCLASEWIEKRSWWFVKAFSAEAVDLDADVVELVLETLDTESDIFLNGQHIGKHHSVHYPFVRDVKDLLLPGENEIAVRLSTGLEKVSDEMLSDLNWAVCREDDNGGKYRGDYRRAFVRRPQYTVGWDWGPRVVTCGITGDVYLRSYRRAAIRDVSVETVAIGETARLAVTVNVENLDILATKSGDIAVEVAFEGKPCARATLQQALLTSGINYLELALEVPGAQLWWPRGYGAQPLYTVSISATVEGEEERYPAFQYGIRTIALDTSIIAGEERRFTLVVNGVHIFCKGGDWIPNDFIYARVTDEKIETLLDEAVAANFNMLRIWGGGLYERDAFYRMCNERGLLLWHDFMFACTTYPDHQQWFLDIVGKEMDYQTRRLRNHPCLALFCGSNEDHWLFNQYDNPRWGITLTQEKQYGMRIANVLAKDILKLNCPFVPYWNSSPYGGVLPNDETVGDVHRWQNGFMSKLMSDRVEPKNYDNVRAKFVSEYGYVGPCCMETIREYLDGAPVERGGSAWEMHTNVFEKDTVYAGISKQYDIGDPASLSMEDYVLYGGMVHGLLLGYSLEAIRFKDFCGGAVFWMYNDAWGEIGWTIIDYYERRKIAFYGVKRAFAHVKLSLRLEDGQLVLQGLNDTPGAVTVTADFGYVSFDGAVKKTRPVTFTLAPASRAYLLREPLPQEDYTLGGVMLLPQGGTVDSVLLRMDDMRTLVYDRSPVRVVSEEADGPNRRLTLAADGFAHGVYVKGGYACSDNYFDLLPGETRTIVVENCGDAVLRIDQVR